MHYNSFYLTFSSILFIKNDFGNCWQFLVFVGSFWYLLAVFGNCWQFLVIVGGFWQFLATKKVAAISYTLLINFHTITNLFDVLFKIIRIKMGL